MMYYDVIDVIPETLRVVRVERAVRGVRRDDGILTGESGDF